MSGIAVEPPRILVTGATGFIGRRLVRRLLNEWSPQSVTCLVKPALTPLESEALQSYQASGIRLIEGDLLNAPIAADPPPRIDLVFHLAANIATDATEEEARVNDLGTARLLEWLGPVSRGVRLLYTSSVAVHDRDRDPAGPISETSPTVPRTAYGRTKLEGERIIQERGGPAGYSWTIVRLPTVYGPGQKPGGLFDKMHRWASSGAIPGRVDWPGRTSIIYVDDAVDAMVELATRDDARNEIYCLDSGEDLTVGELAQRIGRAAGKPVLPVRIPALLLPPIKRIAWSSVLWAIVPGFARVSFWRLSLIVSDGFWFDAGKFRRVYRRPLRSLEEGLAEMAVADQSGRRGQRAASAGETIGPGTR
jgi:UDP-glucose 4-epimerase